MQREGNASGRPFFRGRPKCRIMGMVNLPLHPAIHRPRIVNWPGSLFHSTSRLLFSFSKRRNRKQKNHAVVGIGGGKIHSIEVLVPLCYSDRAILGKGHRYAHRHSCSAPAVRLRGVEPAARTGRRGLDGHEVDGCPCAQLHKRAAVAAARSGRRARRERSPLHVGAAPLPWIGNGMVRAACAIFKACPKPVR